MLSQIIAHSEDGLIIDVFGERSKTIPCLLYVIRKNILCCYTGTCFIVYDLKSNAELANEKVERIKKIKLTDSCMHVGLLLYGKKLNVIKLHMFKDKNDDELTDINAVERITFSNLVTVDDVNDFKMSDYYLLVQSAAQLNIYRNVAGNTYEYDNSIDNVKEYYVFDNILVLVDKKNMLTLHKNGKKLMEFFLDDFDAIDIKNSAMGNFMLLSVNRAQAGCYFGMKELFLISIRDGKYCKLNFQLLCYFTFIKRGYAICYGNQPSSVRIFDYSGKQIREFPKGVRNKIFYNNHENLVCFAGFDNLSGMIEVYDAQTCKIISSFKILGASLISWSPCGSYFLVAITNALKVDNKIVVYDYYGRKINEKHFSSLHDAIWVGSPSKFVYLQKPASLNIYKEELYVPPSFSSTQRFNRYK